MIDLIIDLILSWRQPSPTLLSASFYYKLKELSPVPQQPKTAINLPPPVSHYNLFLLLRAWVLCVQWAFRSATVLRHRSIAFSSEVYADQIHIWRTDTYSPKNNYEPSSSLPKINAHIFLVLIPGGCPSGTLPFAHCRRRLDLYSSWLITNCPSRPELQGWNIYSLLLAVEFWSAPGGKQVLEHARLAIWPVKSRVHVRVTIVSLEWIKAPSLSSLVSPESVVFLLVTCLSPEPRHSSINATANSRDSPAYPAWQSSATDSTHGLSSSNILWVRFTNYQIVHTMLEAKDPLRRASAW